jgi:hypothetical protein
MEKNALFVGGGIRTHIILSLLPIIDGICKKRKINQIIFEKSLENKIKLHSCFIKLSKEYSVEYLEKIKLGNKFFFFIKKILVFFFFFFISFFFRRKYLVNQTLSLFITQIVHSYWDTGIVNNKNKLDTIEFKSKILTCMQLANKFLDFLFLKKKIKCALLGHIVYSERLLYAFLRNNRIDVIRFAGGVLIKQNNDFDKDNKFLEKNIYLNSFKFISKKKINKNWSNFLNGSSVNLDARHASRIKNKNQFLEKLKTVNVIMLHVFKDSPFEIIDTKRIFIDYYNWIIKTLDIIKDSNEIWILRKHPASDRWGEDQRKIIYNIFKKVFDKGVPKNIIFDEDSRSNIEQFKISKRIITYSGSSHLEAACFGIKPIVISDVTLSKFDKRLVWKPKNIQEYKKLLLGDKENMFRLSSQQINISKRILFLLHNVTHVLNELGNLHLFRNDPKYLFNIFFSRVSKKIKIHYEYLYDLGFNLSLKYNQSISKNYFYKFLK